MSKILIHHPSFFSGLPKWAQFFLSALGANVLMVLCSKISIPFWPVPFTLQTFAVLLIGIYLRPMAAATGVGLFLAEGMAGLPVGPASMTHLLGFAFLTGPTAGYLVGFLVAAVFLSVMKTEGYGRTFQSAFAVNSAAALIILTMGVVWLSSIISLKNALMFGFLCFIPGDALKVIVAAAIMKRNHK